MDPNYFFCANPAPTAEDLAEFPELAHAGDQYLNGQFSYDYSALFEDTQVTIPENAAEEVVPQPVPRQEAAQTYSEELRVSEPSWRSHDGSWPEDISLAINNVANLGQSGSASNPLIILDDPEPSQRQLLPGDPGPSSSQNYQQAGHLAGFEALPPNQRLSGLPHPLILEWNNIEIATQRYNRNRYPEVYHRYMTFEEVEIPIARIIREYRVNYVLGIQTFLGSELDHWLQRAHTPGTNAAILAAEFQQAHSLGHLFMQTVQRESSLSFDGSLNLGPEVLNLPRYEGLAHFWGDSRHNILRNRLSHSFRHGSVAQSWFRIESMYRLLQYLVLT
jgi:hypothetical protein